MKFGTNYILLRLLDRRKATKGLALKTLVQRGDEDKMLKCHGTDPNTRNGARLRSPSPIMAPGSIRNVKLNIACETLLLCL